MSTVFKEFLLQQAKKHQAEANAGKAEVDEWRSAIEQLFSEIRRWINESDPEGLIEVAEKQQEIKEPGLGLYQVPRLNLRVFGKWIGIIPKARRTVGTATPPHKSAPKRAEGRVDITDDLRRYVLYRFREDGRNVWMIDGFQPGDGFEPGYPEKVSTAGVVYIPRLETKPLDQETFEKALMSYLR